VSLVLSSDFHEYLRGGVRWGNAMSEMAVSLKSCSLHDTSQRAIAPTHSKDGLAFATPLFSLSPAAPRPTVWPSPASSAAR